LLSNAVKYSPRDRPPQLTVRRQNGDAILTVRDEGIGIPAADQRRIFQAFHRGGNVGGVAGTGLGLVIAKRSCELHGGAITFESPESGGTTFTVTLPLFSQQLCARHDS
jgi:signal transduction histidine kinase